MRSMLSVGRLRIECKPNRQPNFSLLGQVTDEGGALDCHGTARARV
ncbi:hypothetical protein [Paenibacillus phocaensis]|nr:hypothetical protein [Paenibacillus phocaensis]